MTPSVAEPRAGASRLERLSHVYGKFLAALALVGCLILLAMMLIIVADVALRNLAIPGLPGSLPWSNEVSELMLFLITMCVAPWLLRQGQHIRVDIVLQALPKRLAWSLEWVGDLLGFAVNIKTLVTPEWWSLLPLPLVFTLLAVEMVFRMVRLQRGVRGPRHEAVSAA